jgi:putative transposase
MVRDRLGVSERRACRYVGQHRSTQRREPVPAGDDEALRGELRAFAAARPRWGYRRAHEHLAGRGWGVNRKRVQRLWREEGLRVARRPRKRVRAGEGAGGQAKRRATRPGEIWAVDFQADQTQDGRVLRMANVIDEFTRQALVMHVARSVSADELVGLLERLVAEHGAPALLRCDNGPELSSHALRDWCRQSGSHTAFIEPGSPWQNPFVESFHARVRDELLNMELFACLAEARVVVADWREDYNTRRTHSALGRRTPDAFAAAWTAQEQAA